ncbi:MAG: hypothetical protein H6662_01810 [Ardenticatenaceae bacterium]|nr:hypothetical protein [Anaerolineales bacterium]MCB8920294.1 hypothetical protein [Ardenticatenaceae bacterium]
MDTSLLNKLENLGYYTLPQRHEHCIGHTGLLILMRRQPSAGQVTFDPQTIHLRLLDWDGKAHWTTFKANTPFPMSRIICPGVISVQAQNGERATFFVFGGSLEARDESPGEKVYSLRSSAPVLNLSTTNTTADRLAAEVEALWAKLQSSWAMSDEAFWHQLTKVYPFRLFVATIQTILNQYEQTPELHTGQQQELYYGLLHEKTWLQETGQWPEPVPTLEDLRP